MSLPPPPEIGFQFKANEGELIALRVLRKEMVPDTFQRNNGQPQEGVILEVWPLTGKAAGQLISPLTNTSALGKQFLPVAGDGQVYYGRLKGENVGQGRRITLDEPYASDSNLIDAHRSMYAGEVAKLGTGQGVGGTAHQHDYRDDQLHQQTPPVNETITEPAAAPAGSPPGMSQEDFQRFQEWQKQQAADTPPF